MKHKDETIGIMRRISGTVVMRTVWNTGQNWDNLLI